MNFSTKKDGTTVVEVPSVIPDGTITDAKVAIIETYFTHVEKVLRNAITEKDIINVTSLSPFVVLLGPPGVGKTASINQIALDLNEIYSDFKKEGVINKDVTFEAVTFSLGSANSTDVLGVPYLSREQDESGKEVPKVKIATNEIFTDAIERIDKALKEGKEHFVIFFFDEITNVTYNEVTNFLMKFIDEGILVNKRLPDDVRKHILIAAAGNTMENSDLAQSNKLSDPIMRRASIVIKIIFTPEGFVQWSKGSLHPYVWGFLDQFPRYVYVTLQNQQEKMQITPSKWFDVSDFVTEKQNEIESNKWAIKARTLKRVDPNLRGKDLEREDSITITLKNKLGSTLGTLFKDYLQYARHIPSISELVEKGISVVPPFAKMDAKGKEHDKDVQLNFGLLAAFMSSLQSNIETSIDILRKNPTDQESIKKINKLYNILADMIMADFQQTNQDKGQKSEREKQNANKEFKYFINTETTVGLILPMLELLFQNEANSFVVKQQLLSPQIYDYLTKSMQVLYNFDKATFTKVSNLIRERESSEAERG
jgi:nucleoside-triphosphatase THEP1